MGRTARKTTGPLSTTQNQIMHATMRGERQVQIAKDLQCSQAHISQELYVARAKLGAETVAHAASRMQEALTYLRTAELLEAAKLPEPHGSLETHLNHVLAGIAQEYRTLAAKILPEG